MKRFEPDRAENRRQDEAFLPKAQEIYRHFRGKLYQVITLARKEDTGEMLVIYQALYAPFTVYARALRSFTEKLDPARYPNAGQEYRFEKTGSAVPGETGPSSAPAKKEQEAPDQKRRAEETEGADKGAAEDSPQEKGSPDDRLISFLDAPSVTDKLKILDEMKDGITNQMIDTMAVSLDLEIPGDDPARRLMQLRDCLLTREKYELRR